MKTLFIQIAISFFLCLPSTIKSDTECQKESKAESREDLFSSDELIQINLVCDYDSIQADRGEDPSYHDGRVECLDLEGNQVIVECRIKTRGNFRKDPDNCRFPPLMVNIKKKSASGSIFEGKNKLKLVTHCQTERYVIEEYLIYKLYNQINDLSFRVRLAEVSYVHKANGKQKTLFTRFGFFIEEDEDVAQRHNARIIDKNFHQVQVNRENMLKQAMFQFMIGNKDWYVTTRHNIRLLEIGVENEIFAVPYDFDWSAIIYPSYTMPRNIPRELLEKRQVYKGLCLSDEEMDIYRDYFNEMRPGFISIYNDCDYLSKGATKQAIRYMNNFYKMLNDSEHSRTIFQENCLKPPPGIY